MTHIQYPEKPMAEVKGQYVTVQSPLLTRNELARVLGVHPLTVTRLAKTGQIKKVVVCGQERYPADQNRIDQYIKIKEG